MQSAKTKESLKGRTYNELHRPQFHFSPQKNWMNDPNGLIKLNGVYHLYFQYNPKGDQWGNMCWGHATSNDLVHWNEQEVALPEKEHMIFSGTTAVDPDTKILIAAFTSFEHSQNAEGELIPEAQHQSIAKSYDGGYFFEEISENPVLDIDSKEFRDPKLFFDTRTQKWNMLVSLATEHKIAFYQSVDLVQWKKASEFGPMGNTNAVWECPDLFELTIDGTKETKWVLTVSAGHPEEGHLGIQYFIGDFDGTEFIADEGDYPLYLDHGKDFYAGITFANTGQKKFATMMAWAGSHVYAYDTPTSPWRGVMSLPRDLQLIALNNELSLCSKPPFDYVEPLYEQTLKLDGLRLSNGTKELPVDTKAFVAILQIENAGAIETGIKILKSKNCETEVGVDFINGNVYLDRRNSSTEVFNDNFPSRDIASVKGMGNKVRLDIFVDHSIVEVFINSGKVSLTSLIFPDTDGHSLELFATGGMAVFDQVEVVKVKSIWKK